MGRGRADAELNYSGETPESAARFEERALPPGALDLERSQLLGVGAGAPRTDPTQEASTAAPTRASVGEATWKRRLAPRHRDAVRSYFGEDSR